jgi:hypothetical protein
MYYEEKIKKRKEVLKMNQVIEELDECKDKMLSV